MTAVLNNKKGFLLGEFTLKIIIAVFCLILLVGLVFGIYNMFSSNEEKTQAKATLNNIILNLDSATDNVPVNLPLLDPKDWKLAYSGIDSRAGCISSCLCLQKDRWLRESLEVCIHVSGKNIVLGSKPIQIENAKKPISINIKKQGNDYIIEKA